MEQFYLSLASGSQIKTARTLKYQNILINFMTKTNRPPKYNYENLFIDSGGFYSSMRSGGYTKSNDEYLDYIQKWQPQFFALRDYPCEPELLKKHNMTVQYNIKRTVENHLILLNKIESGLWDIHGKPIPVIQGWEIEDYLHCIDLFTENGVTSDYMAIGSVCRRNQTEKIKDVILAVRDNVPLWTKLHGFGVKLTALKDLVIWKALYSVDSGAWDYVARWKKFRGEEMNIPDASLNAAINYIAKIKLIHERHAYQRCLI